MAASHAALTVLSGPAAGAVGAATVGALAGAEHVLSFDMGGTSCDVAVIDEGRVRQAARQTIAGRVLQLPMVDVHTVGAGGGSIGWADSGARCGSDRNPPAPSPVLPATGAGGRRRPSPTRTSCSGISARARRLRVASVLDKEAAERAVDELGRRARHGSRRDRLGHLASRRPGDGAGAAGRDRRARSRPRSYALVAFGGAGPMHAARMAEELEHRSRDLPPRSRASCRPSGLVVSERRRDSCAPSCCANPTLPRASARSRGRAGRTRRGSELPGARLEVSYDLRYRGQAFELTVPGPLGRIGPRCCASVSSGRTRNATATPTRTARSSS